jgi:hypothetical protein
MQKEWRYLALYILLSATCGGMLSCNKPKPHQETSGMAASDDMDGDGIPDSWERDGFEIEYPDGAKRTLSSSPVEHDIFVYVAWMEDSTHTHKPDPDAVAAVVASFHNSPVGNIDKSKGVALHIVYANAPVPEQPLLGNSDNEGNYDWTAFNKIKSASFAHLVKTGTKPLDEVMYYCLFAHDFSTKQYSGITKTIPGKDFLVTLGGFTNQVGTPAEQAGTLIHELGHALGLHHGGYEDKNYKPNYLSVMNYLFQMGGVPEASGVYYTYSSFVLNADEQHLSDSHALTTDASLGKYGSEFICPGGDGTMMISIPSISGPVDWRCDHQQREDIKADVNMDGQITKLPGRDDWGSLMFVTSSSSAAGVTPGSISNSVSELSATEADKIKMFPINGISASKMNNGEVRLSWQGRPLGQVLSYTVLRQRSDSTKPIVVGRTSGTTFIDATVPKGTIEYYVSAVYAPHSFQAQQGSFTPDLGSGDRVLAAAARQGALNSSAALVGKFRLMGLVPSSANGKHPVPKVLLQSDLSLPAVVE